MKYFCRRFDGGYVPAELGVAKFSIEDGVKDQLHMHINPVSIPIGMQYEAQQHANTHGLPLPPHALGGTNMNEIAQKLLTFLDVKKEIPLLFTDAKNIPQVEQMLGEILGYHINGKTLYIGSMAELLFQLKQAAEYHMMSLKVFPSVTKAQQFLDDTTLILTTGISCEYHESLEFVAECALSECLCWSYTATLSCCLEMIVEPLPGKHYPYHLDPKRLYMLRQKFAIMDLQQIQSRKKESDHSKPANKRPQISNSNIYYQRVDQLTPQSLEERTDFRCSIEPEMGYIDLRVGDTGRRTFDRHHTH
ncbi:protein maelstrom homolog [Anopheles moucheti]|uniref:protein maelstrom homolog n=1 Tax=Anopheles moucheti TaxID=186751 RepID=UPI0022F0252A|nr:protein maelstrom homolog [Anopheles moucheti]